MEQQTKEKMLGIIESEIALYAGMVATEMKRIKEQSDPALVAIGAEALSRYNYALKTLIGLRTKMEEAE